MSEGIRYGRKRNGIRKELREKIEDWVDTIDDGEVKRLVRQNTIITGGSIASMLLGEKVNDYDVYFRDKETTIAVANYYVKKFNEANNLEVEEGVNRYAPFVTERSMANVKGELEDRVLIYIRSAGVAGEAQTTYAYFEGKTQDETEEFADSVTMQEEDDKKGRYRPVFLSQNAITLSNKMQIVIRFYGEPEKIHSNYDFVHAMNYYDFGRDELKLHPEALEALLSRTLVYKGSLYPIASIFRMKKFLERGWRISAGEQLKIMWQISEVNLKEHPVIAEQLTGVDQAYLWQLTKALEEVDTDLINASYVGAIIDRIFDGAR